MIIYPADCEHALASRSCVVICDGFSCLSFVELLGFCELWPVALMLSCKKCLRSAELYFVHNQCRWQLSTMAQVFIQPTFEVCRCPEWPLHWPGLWLRVVKAKANEITLKCQPHACQTCPPCGWLTGKWNPGLAQTWWLMDWPEWYER